MSEELIAEVMAAFHISREQALALAAYCVRMAAHDFAEVSAERGYEPVGSEMPLACSTGFVS